MKAYASPMPDAIRIRYIGNSCFYIIFQDGTRLITDPYGYKYEIYFGKFPELEADVITISHNHEDHTYGVGLVEGDPLIIKTDQGKKKFSVGEVEITGYTSDHVANMGQNTIFIYQSKGLKIVHMGETDCTRSQEITEAVNNADVILTYAGQFGKIKNKESFAALFELGVKVMIPQHYSNNPKHIFYGEPTIEDIIKDVPEEVMITGASEFIVKPGMDRQFAILST